MGERVGAKATACQERVVNTAASIIIDALDAPTLEALAGNPALGAAASDIDEAARLIQGNLARAVPGVAVQSDDANVER